jgi:chitinase
MDFAGLDSPADDGIPDNICAPTFDAGDGRGNIKHSGFALLTTDDWFHAHAAEANLNGLYDQAPPNRRSWVQGRGLVVVGSNSSRAATPEEFRRELGFDSCGDDECSRELLALREVTDTMKEAIMPSRPVGVAAEATPESEGVVVREAVVGSLPGSDHSDPQFPRETGSHGSVYIHALRKRQL